MNTKIAELFSKQHDLELQYNYKYKKVEEFYSLLSLLDDYIKENKDDINIEAKKIIRNINNNISELIADMDLLEDKLLDVFNKLNNEGAYEEV